MKKKENTASSNKCDPTEHTAHMHALGTKSCRREDKQKKKKEIAMRVQIILYALLVATQHKQSRYAHPAYIVNPP